MSTIDRRAYADMFGPTVGDRVRLGDTELWIEVEEDKTTYGEEVKFGGGKVIRDGMGQSQRTSKDAVDVVITNALILDHWGIVKADIGIKEGRIVGVGKAGNPDIQSGVDIIIGPSTEAIAGEGLIATAGGIDAHIHFICPQQVDDALMSGITTMMVVERDLQLAPMQLHVRPDHGTFNACIRRLKNFQSTLVFLVKEMLVCRWLWRSKSGQVPWA